MIKHGYKIVKKTADKLTSVTAIGEGYTVYPPGETVHAKPGCGPMAVFNDVFFARKYYNGYYLPHCRMWRCEYEDSNRECLYGGGDYAMCRDDTPFGTAFAESVKLIEEVRI